MTTGAAVASHRYVRVRLLERYWASFQVIRLFHSRLITKLWIFSLFFFCFFFFIKFFIFFILFFIFFLGGGAQPQWIYYLVMYTDLKAAEGFRRFKRRSCRSCYRFSPYYIRFACPKFYMPTLIDHGNNSKIAPISLYLFEFQAAEACLSAIFSVVNTYAIQDTRLFHILNSFVHVGLIDMLTTGAVSLAVNCERV